MGGKFRVPGVVPLIYCSHSEQPRDGVASTPLMVARSAWEYGVASTPLILRAAPGFIARAASNQGAGSLRPRRFGAKRLKRLDHGQQHDGDQQQRRDLIEP